MGDQVKVEKIQSELFRNLSDEMSDDDLIRVKGELRRQKSLFGFGGGDIERTITRSEHVFEKLKRKGFIKLGDYRTLRKLFEELGMDELCEIVSKAENQMRAMHWPVESDSVQQEIAARGGAYGHPQPLIQGQGHVQYAHGGYAIPPGGIGTYPPQPPMQYPLPGQTAAHRHDRTLERQQYVMDDQGGYQPLSSVVIPGDAAPRHSPYYQAPVPQQEVQRRSPALPLQSQQYSLQSSSMADASGSSSLPSLGSNDVFTSNPPQSRPYNNSIFYEPGRGYVLFINNLFTGKPSQRTGADKDEANVKKLFRDKLPDFYLQYAKDVTKHELEGYLRSLKNNLSSGMYNSLILIMGTHGEPKTDNEQTKKDGVQMADDEWMLVDDIIANFHGDHIPAMKDKPKVFIIQSCRGLKKQRSISYSDSPAEVSSVPIDQPPPMYTRPVNSDILIAYATTEGTRAWRNEDEGSWFVHDLCKQIGKFYDKEHILDILVRVNNEMVWRESTEGRAKQMPCFVCTFTKRFMLAPPNNNVS